MALVTIPFEPAASRPPSDVRRYLRVAARRAERFHARFHIPAFVVSDVDLAYAALCHLEASGLAPGDRFAEWGSGLGVVSCLAAMVGFVPHGFEIEARLVAAARRLAADFDVPAEFTRGSFIPKAARRLMVGQAFGRLTTGGRCGHSILGLDIADFDVVYVYPWPDEERLVERLFTAEAKVGALLLTYHGAGEVRLRRKEGPTPGRDERRTSYP